MADLLVCDIVVREFEFKLHYYIHFGANTLGKCINPFILRAVDQKVSLLFVNKDDIVIK